MAAPKQKRNLFEWQAPGFLKSVRERLGISQDHLSRLSGVTRSVIANIEAERTVLGSMDDALRLYRALANATAGDLRAVSTADAARKDAMRAVVDLLGLERKGYERMLQSGEADLAQLPEREKFLRQMVKDLKQKLAAGEAEATRLSEAIREGDKSND